MAAWCQAGNRSTGGIVALATLGRLGAEWYRGLLAPGWRRRTPGEATALFEQLGLTGPFWSPTG